MVKKAKPVKARPKKGQKKTVPKVVAVKENKRVPKALRIVEIAAATLQNYSDGEFDLPSTLVRYTSGPKVGLGLHRQYYIPFTHSSFFHDSESSVALEIYNRQAANVVSEIISDGFAITNHNEEIPLCEDCQDG